MEAWCPVVCGLCLAGIVAGVLWLCRSRGPRIVSGRRSALLSYAGLFVAAAFTAGIACLHGRIHPILSANPILHRVLFPFLVATPFLLAAALLALWLNARSLGRSVIFRNVRRDDVAAALAGVLRESNLPVSHRLRTFRDEFRIPGLCIIVHGAVGLSRVEFSGTPDGLPAQIAERLIARLTRTLAARGCNVIDARRLTGAR